MKTLYLVDAVNFLFRSYYAIGPMTNHQGVSTNALFGFVRSMYKIIADFSPDYLVAIFDGPDNKKARTEMYADYKKHRKAMPEDLVPQLMRSLEWCELAGIPSLSIPEVEADDTIGSIARWAEKQEITTYICSSDKDLCQLVSDKIFLIHPHKENALIDKKAVEDIYGITPEQMVDYLAITGDASDNIPGLEGFGPKTAASLLQKFRTLDHILAHPELVPGEKKQETLRNGQEIALLSRRLATINPDVDFPKEEVFFHLKEPNTDQLKIFYQEMHFSSLLKDLDSQAYSKKSGKEESLTYTLVNDDNTLKQMVTSLLEASSICFDTETTSLEPMEARLIGVGFSIQPEKAWYLPLNGAISRKTVLATLETLFSHRHIGFYGHNVKYDLHILCNEDLPLPNITFDTILASYLLSPQNPKHNLDQLSLDKLHKVKIPITDLLGKGKSIISMQDVPIEKVCAYCCEDTDCTVRLKELFEKDLSQEDVLCVLKEIELPLVPVLLMMERRGIFMDADILKKMSHELALDIKRLEAAIYHLAGEEFNLNSPKQLSKILFEKMGIKPPKKTKTGYSTSVDILEELNEGNPIVKEIIEYRITEKLRSTYVDALPQTINPRTGRIHCTFNQSVTATGRLSCQNPNLQNIPVRSLAGKKIREAFKPQDSGWSFLSADYSQIELRILAHLSEDPILLKSFQEDEDVHAYTASVVFDVPLREVSPEMRQKAKAVNFGILYGQQAFGLSQGLGIPYKEAASFIDTYFKRYKKVKEFIEFCKESVHKSGVAITITGRKRPIPEITSKNPMIRAAAERLAINTPLQGTAADLIKIAMIQIDAFLQTHKSMGSMLLQIHDELLFESPDSEISKLSHKVQHSMEHVIQLKVPLKVHISIGKNWGEC
jgi:DNA polymerase-1